MAVFGRVLTLSRQSNMKTEQKHNLFCLLLLFLLAAGYACVFSYLLIMKYYTFNPPCLLNGIGIRMIKNFLTDGFLRPYYMEQISGLKHCLVLYPGMILTAPLFLLFPYPEWPLVVQALIVACAVFPLFYLARRALDSRLLALSVVFSYLLHPDINLFTLQGFRHPVTGLPILLWLFYFMLKKDKRGTILFLILSNLLMINTVWMTAISGLVFYSIRKHPFDKTVFKISAIWFIVQLAIFTTLLILNKDRVPAEYVHLHNYAGSVSSALKTAVAHPSVVISTALQNIRSLKSLFTPPAGIFALFSWYFLLPAVCEMGFDLIASNRISTFAFVLPFLFLAAVYGIASFRKMAVRLFSSEKNCISVKDINALLAVFIFAGAVITHYFFPAQHTEALPFSKKFDRNKYTMTKHAYIGHYVLNLIPKTASCLSTKVLTNHLYACKRIGDFPYHLERYPWDYILVDTKNTPEDANDSGNSLKQLLKANSGYGKYLFIDGYLLLKKDFPQNGHQKLLKAVGLLETKQ